jgi:hypothetical protein
MVEIINLQETLSDSIQASLGARAQKRKRGSHKASIEEEDVRFVLLIDLNYDCFICCLCTISLPIFQL